MQFFKRDINRQTRNGEVTFYNVGDSSSQSSSGGVTLDQVRRNFVSIEFFKKLFQAHDSTDSDNILNIDPNDTDSTITDIEFKFGSWSSYFISALGRNSSGGGGGGSVGVLNDLDDVDTTGAANGKVLTYQNGMWVPGTGGGSGSVSWADITDKPTTLSGYGITDAIPLGGSNYITGTLRPNTNNSINLGSSSYRWKYVYGVNGSFSSSLTVGGTDVSLDGHTHSASDITSGTFAAARIPTGISITGNAATATKASKVIDSYNTSKEITITYAKDGQSSTSWLASWNGYELGSISPSNITAGAAVKDGAGNTITSKYVTLDTPQIISESKTFSSTVKLSGAGIEDVGGAGLLAYHLAWVGTDTSRWTVGTIDSQGVIRSGNQDLEHYRYTGDTSTSYRWSIIDTYNILSNLVYDSNFGSDAPCAKLVTIKITSTYRNEGINFSIVGRGSSTPCHVSIKFSNSSSSDPSLDTFCYEGNPTYGVRLHLYKTATSTWEVWASKQQTYDRTYVYNVTARQGITITPHRSAYASALPSSPLASYSCSPTVAYSTYIYFRNTADSGNAGYCGRGSTANNDIALMAYSGDLLLGSHDTVQMRFTSSAIFTLASMNFGIGISNPTQRLHVDGNILATGEVTALSDIRYKSKVSNVNTRVDDIANLPIFYYKWKYKDDDDMHIGTSAQAVKILFPELVIGTDELSVNYGVLGTTIGILNSRNLMEYDRRIKFLEMENNALRERIKALEDRV